MKPANDALIVDTTGLGLDDVLEVLVRDVRARLDAHSTEVAS